MRGWWRRAAPAAVLACLAVLPYVRSVRLPFISDDYIQIALGRQYGPMENWPALAADPLYRCRASSVLQTHWTEAAGPLTPPAAAATSLLLHILCTWLVAALGAWRRIGWWTSLPAAGFFALYEGHQEAVIWYAALPELLVFLFSLGCLLLWLRWLRGGGLVWWLAAFGAFGLGLASKESAVAIVPMLLAAAVWEGRTRRAAAALAPFALLSVGYALTIYAARSGHLHLNDGTFSLHAPVVWNLVNSLLRMLWFWGALALAVLAASRRRREWLPPLLFALSWMGVTLLPYSFLTYMNRVPSRHTYLASAGLALVVGLAAQDLMARRPARRWLMVVLALVVAIHNAGYVWWRKTPQFAERAASTEQLIAFARRHRRPFALACFPYTSDVARRAVEVGAGLPPELVVTAPGAAPDGLSFCYVPTSGGGRKGE